MFARQKWRAIHEVVLNGIQPANVD